MNETTSTADSWDACPQGELSRMARSIKSKRRDKVIARVIGAAGAVVIVAVSLTIAAQQLGEPTEPNFGGIVCSDVCPKLQDYMAGKLDEKLAGQIESHLAECPDCGPMFQKMKAEMGSAQIDCDDRSSCLCDGCFHRSAVAIVDVSAK